MDMRKCDICGKIYPEDTLRYEMSITEVQKRDEDSKKPRRSARINMDVCAECKKIVLNRIGIAEEKEKELTVTNNIFFEF